MIVNSERLIILCGLAAWLVVAGPCSAGEAGPGGLAQMREWLGQRNLERKQLGLPGADITLKKHFASARPRPHAEPKPPAVAAAPEYRAEPAPPSRGTPVLHIGRGPDGRIHHRLVIKDEGPDQLQVFTPSGYAPVPADEAARLETARLERLTPRGRRVWMAGSSLRVPGSRWLKPGLDPKNKAP